MNRFATTTVFLMTGSGPAWALCVSSSRLPPEVSVVRSVLVTTPSIKPMVTNTYRETRRLVTTYGGVTDCGTFLSCFLGSTIIITI